MTASMLVTAATGNVGRATLAALRKRGVRVRAGVRDPSRSPWKDDEGVEAVRLDFTDPTTFPGAVAGAAGVLIVRPPAISRVGSTVNRLVDAAARAGVRQATVLSVAGAERNRVVPHHRIETHVRASGMAWTMLRPGFFCQNVVDAYADDVRLDDRIYVPGGQGAVAWVDARDVGELAALTLLDSSHAGRGYLLTGPRAEGFAEVAGTLSELLGRPIAYVPASVPGYLRHLIGTRHLPVPQALVQAVLHVGLRSGQEPDPTLEQLLGRAPRTVGEYLADNADALR